MLIYIDISIFMNYEYIYRKTMYNLFLFLLNLIYNSLKLHYILDKNTGVSDVTT